MSSGLASNAGMFPFDDVIIYSEIVCAFNNSLLASRKILTVAG